MEEKKNELPAAGAERETAPETAPEEEVRAEKPAPEPGPSDAPEDGPETPGPESAPRPGKPASKKRSRKLAGIILLCYLAVLAVAAVLLDGRHALVLLNGPAEMSVEVGTDFLQLSLAVTFRRTAEEAFHPLHAAMKAKVMF